MTPTPLDAQAPEAIIRDARRYRRLQVLGCAVGETTQLANGTVSRFTNLDKIVDDDLTAHPSRGEAPPRPEPSEAGETRDPTDVLGRVGQWTDAPRPAHLRQPGEMDGEELRRMNNLAVGYTASVASPPPTEPLREDAELITRLAEMLRKSRKTIANICSGAGALIEDSKFVVEIEGALRDAAIRLSSLSAKGETER